MKRWGLLLLLVLLLTATMPACGARAARPVEIDVSAAASLREALTDVGAAFMASNPDIRLTFNYGASGTLARQIERGAPVDVFASASQEQMRSLEEKDLLLAGTRRDFARNELVLIQPEKPRFAIGAWMDLRGPDVHRIAIGDPRVVPAGAYARQALEHLGLYAALQDRLIYGEDVRQVLVYVERGEVDAGIVYRTDLEVAHGVRVQQVIPVSSYQSPVYPVAVIRSSSFPKEAQRFTAFLTAPEGQRILAQHGFLSP